MIQRFFIICFLLCFVNPANCEFYWQKQEKIILNQAQLMHYPIVAVFLGNERCAWSKKLEEEVLQKPEFYQKVNKGAVIWQVAGIEEEMNKSLREKYRVVVSPLIVLLDPRGKEFARIEYIPLDAKGYAREMNTLIENFQEVCLALEQKESFFEENRWQDLYQKAKKFSAPWFKHVIIEKGLQQEKGTFFHLEKLATLLEKHKLKNPHVLQIKKQLLKLDPHNQLGTHFKVAVLEFHKILSKLKQNDPYQKPLKPLLQFIYAFGKSDHENLWRAELLIANYLFTKHCILQALEHARASYEAAPGDFKPYILEIIAYFTKNLSS